MLLPRSRAIELLHSKMQNQNLRRHCYSVEAVMRALARHFNGNQDIWGMVGLLHDGDYEQTKDDMPNHSVLMAKWLKDSGETDETILDGIVTHGRQKPVTQLDWALFCCDELTGLIVATTLVQPDKKLAGVTVEKVLDKFKTKSFAAGAKREDIVLCESKLNIPLPEFIGIALKAMQEIAANLGL